MRNLTLPFCYSFSLFYMGLAFAVGSPYSVENITSPTKGEFIYHYDTHGNRLGHSQQQTIAWGLVNKPVSIVTAKGQERFAYGLSARRYMRNHPGHLKTLYLDTGDVEYRISSSGEPQTIVYIRPSGYSPLAQVAVNGTNIKYIYFAQDHLGTPVVSVAGEGGSHAQRRYDAWGDAVSAEGSSIDLPEAYRGFTGHENIASAELIHMNGRVYDPWANQFMAGDRYIHPRRSPAGLNRYSYMSNSPINGVDWSGWLSIFTTEARTLMRNIFENAHFESRSGERVRSSYVTQMRRLNQSDTVYQFSSSPVDSIPSMQNLEIHGNGQQLLHELVSTRENFATGQLGRLNRLMSNLDIPQRSGQVEVMRLHQEHTRGMAFDPFLSGYYPRPAETNAVVHVPQPVVHAIVAANPVVIPTATEARRRGFWGRLRDRLRFRNLGIRTVDSDEVEGIQLEVVSQVVEATLSEEDNINTPNR